MDRHLHTYSKFKKKRQFCFTEHSANTAVQIRKLSMVRKIKLPTILLLRYMKILRSLKWGKNDEQLGFRK